MVKDQTDLKRLQTKRDKILSEIEEKNVELRKKAKELEKDKSELKKIITKITGISKKEIIISEHAILRYVERVIGIDLEEIKEKIIPKNSRDTIKKIGDGKYPIDSHTIVIKNGVVVSVVKQI
jgi:hypothetical protein